VNQALLKGFGLDVNLAGIRQARLDADISQYELRGYVTALVSNVERGYWDLCLAQEQVIIVERSLAIAKQGLDDAKTLVSVGKIAEVELIAAEAEVASRLGNQIDALAARDAARINLLRLMNPAGPQALTGELTLAEKPFVPAAGAGPVEEHVAVALRLRPDLNQAKLQYQRGQLELVQTRNGLLPQLDLFVSLGRTGYADSFGGSFKGETAKGWDATVGLNLGYTFGNREANATQRRSQLSTEQRKEALKNQQQLAEADVRLAHLEINRTRQQIDATAASSRLQNAKAKVEHEKLRVGSSTTLLVAQVDRDVLAAELAAISAVASHLKALIDLYRLDGSLLDRRSLSAPGTQSVEMER
jgi:outer membrane protein TolC